MDFSTYELNVVHALKDCGRLTIIQKVSGMKEDREQDS